MGKNLEPRCKQCRRIGEKLFLKGEKCNTPKCPIVRRNYPPGFHGPKGRGRQTDFGLQLAQKQKLKKIYNVLEKQLIITFEKAKKVKGDIGLNLLTLLETRLDNVVYRLNYSQSRRETRQLVNHGHFTVNGKSVNIPSFQVKPGDIVKVVESSKRFKFFKEWQAKQKKEIPGWMHLEKEDGSAKVLHAPGVKDLDQNINMRMIVEYYSR